ncbi:MAG: hypothetical protein HKN21_15005 [Candidatus Eisenbacteria bacterium]|uniref:Uncharacterized protein n=1 Tax=Eiseniibacteriota bacterium TaxID=2212470 RepID=A0A7Y2EDN1_UNCEI|nr:hypothetical protein [Candidatus Eisenbacteria bacterium]
MSDNSFLDRLQKALKLSWKEPPKEVDNAKAKPKEEPIQPPPPGSSAETLTPADIRSGPGGKGGMVSRSFPGLDVTLMVTPPDGDGLWEVRGRAWRNPKADLDLTVVLVQGENVLDQSVVANGASFSFQDSLSDAWSLEFHLAEGNVVVLDGPPKE